MRPVNKLAEGHGAKLLGAAVFTVVLFLIVSPKKISVPSTWLRAASSPGTCKPVGEIVEEVYRDPKTAPQLQPDHVRWITTELDPLREGRPPHFLVFGLGACRCRPRFFTPPAGLLPALFLFTLCVP